MPSGCSSDGEFVVPPVLKVTNGLGEPIKNVPICLFIVLDFDLDLFPVETFGKLGLHGDIAQVANLPFGVEQSMTLGMPVSYVFRHKSGSFPPNPLGKEHLLFPGGGSDHLRVVMMTDER
jgi:hypothetical protein